MERPTGPTRGANADYSMVSGILGKVLGRPYLTGPSLFAAPLSTSDLRAN